MSEEFYAPRKLPSWVAALTGGLAAALAHPPFGIIILIFGYAHIMHAAETARNVRRAFWRGWLAGLAYFAISCWWIAEAFLVDVETFGWMAPFAVALMAGGLALFWGLAAAVYRALRPTGPWRFLVFAGVLAAFEWLRGHIFTGFPWNLPGTSWGAGGLVSQNAHWLGAYGLTWLTIAIGSAPMVLVDRVRTKGRYVAVGATGLALAALYGAGALRLGGVQEANVGDAINVRVVQANIPQAAKYDSALYQSMVERYLALSTQPPAKGASLPKLIVWPEGALPVSLDSYLAPGDPVRAAITSALVPGQTLIVGGYRSDGPDSFNSLVAIERMEADIAITGIYDKHHLVPFGEYVPRFFAAIGLQQLVPLAPFTPGPAPQPINIGPARIQPLICYEALFPGYVSRGAAISGVPAQVIVAISNDAWFGATSGPWQHHNQARYRAIEEGLPMIRATPTGVSSVIDRYGRVERGQSLGLGQAGVIDAQVYVVRRQDGATRNDVHLPPSYSRSRGWSFLGMLALSCLVLGSFYGKIRKKYVT